MLTLLGTLGQEIASALGKQSVAARELHLYTVASLHLLAGVALWVILAAIRPSAFIFSAASLPTFLTRLILEIVLAHLGILALVRADRSTFGFFRALTIPLLAGIDLILGYPLSFWQIIGLIVIVVTLALLWGGPHLQRAGRGLVLTTAILAALTLSLYKYNITHFNSVAGEQLPIHLGLLIYFWILARYQAKANLWQAIRQPSALSQTLAQGIGGVIESFAYQFAPASVIVGAKRAAAVLWSTVAGRLMFKEENFRQKLGWVIILTLAILLLAIG